MPVVKGGVWTNIEDEVLKASVSKYGLNQWARVSSLLARKTPKQCKARWVEWLDPSIRKIEWSKEEDEKLLHLAKLMPTQWRTIAPMVGRTATQCLERYQKLLDEAEARESDELGLGGPAGGETAAPSADDVRRLRPGELDPDPESKPARPDTIDLDEDEKEMLSEARARLANTQGKKAKRKARERQLEESRRLALLQKRRELKNAGINIKITNRKKGQMDYNADIPFEKKAAPGFYDTQEENEQNEKQREAFDPRKQQLANKRKGDQEDDMQRKKQKGDKPGPSAAFAAAAKAGQMQKIREAEQSSKRRPLNLPAPQVGEAELEDIVKMGMIGEQAHRSAGEGDNEATKGFIGNYSGIVGGTPIRTPRAPPQEDHIANEIRNIRALTETQSSLLGGENTPLHEGSGSTGFDGVTPRKHVVATPNPMATPMRQGGVNGVGATPMRTPGGPGATPMRTPRDRFAINQDDPGASHLVGSTPREVKLREQALRSQLKSQFAALPKPKELDFELELPEEQQEADGEFELSEEDAAERDRRNRAFREAAERADFKRRTQVMQQNLPRPSVVDVDSLLKAAVEVSDPIQAMIAEETALLIANDAYKYPVSGSKVQGASRPLEVFDDDALDRARLEIALELPSGDKEERQQEFEASWDRLHEASSSLLGLAGYEEDDVDERQILMDAFDQVQATIADDAEKGRKVEKRLALHYGGYQQRANKLRQKIVEASAALQDERVTLDSLRTLQVMEESALPRRLESMQDEVAFVKKREKEAQDMYRIKMAELDGLANGNGHVNGYSSTRSTDDHKNPYMTLAANHMAIHRRNEFLDTGFSEDDEDVSSSYEAAADSRIAGLGRHRSKRQKLPVEHSDSNEETDHDSQDDSSPIFSPADPSKPSQSSTAPTTNATESISPNLPPDLPKKRKPLTTSAVAATNKRAHKAGVIYLSRIPPFMRPSTVRTLLSVHGTITRLFLTPETPSTYLSRRKAGGNKKHSYIDGWVEFSRKRDAKICVDAINGQIVGGKKGGWYRDDVWNAKYLKGFGWSDLMAGVRGEEREREERVRVGVGRERRERAEFLRNLERARVEGTRRAKAERRAERARGAGEGGGAKGVVKTDAFERRFRQNEVKRREEQPVEQSDETRRVLSKIF